MPKLMTALEKALKRQKIEDAVKSLKSLEKYVEALKKSSAVMEKLSAQLKEDLSTLEKALKNRKLKKFLEDRMGKRKAQVLDSAKKLLKAKQYDKLASKLADLALEPNAPTAVKQLKEIAERLAEENAKWTELSTKIQKILKNLE